MIRLVKASILFTTLFAALLIASHGQPAQDRFAGLHLDECKLPCWEGQQPGITTLDDSVKKIEAHLPGTPIVICMEYSECYERVTDGAHGLNEATVTYSEKGIVSAIELDTGQESTDPLRLADFYIMFGQPTHLILPIYDGGYWFPYGLEFETANAKIYTYEDVPLRDSPNWNDQVKRLTISNQEITIDTNEQVPVPWMGARTFQSYWCSGILPPRYFSFDLCQKR